LKTGGTDSTTCTKYTSPCATIEFVMTEIVNKTIESIICIDSGIFYYDVIGTEDSETGAYFNRTFNLIGYFLGPFVNIDDKNTYPIIICNSSSDGISFYLYENVVASFQYLKFIVGNNSGENRWLIMSFYLFIYCLLFIYFLFIGSKSDNNISVSIINCIFSSEFKSNANWTYIYSYFGKFVIENCFYSY
jgi:hypothetical protein